MVYITRGLSAVHARGITSLYPQQDKIHSFYRKETSRCMRISKRTLRPLEIKQPLEPSSTLLQNSPKSFTHFDVKKQQKSLEVQETCFLHLFLFPQYTIRLATHQIPSCTLINSIRDTTVQKTQLNETLTSCCMVALSFTRSAHSRLRRAFSSSLTTHDSE